MIAGVMFKMAVFLDISKLGLICAALLGEDLADWGVI